MKKAIIWFETYMQQSFTDMMIVVDKNYVEVDIIIDNGTWSLLMEKFRNVNDDETRIYLSSPKEWSTVLDLF